MQKYHDTIQEENGDIVTTATVTVFDANTGTPSSIFEDNETTPLNNPFTISDSNYDSNGSFWFKAANGNYDIQVVIGSDTELKEDVTLFDSEDAGVLLNKLDATVAPTVNDDSDDGYSEGSYWIDVTGDQAYRCVDDTVGAAVWIKTTLQTTDLGALALLNTAPIANGGTGQTSAQAAINALSQVSAATNEHVLTKDTGTGDAIWKVVNPIVADGSITQAKIDTTELNPIVQIARIDDGAVATGTTVIPKDDTIPQITEGDEYMAVTITPTSATNKLTIEAQGICSSSSTGGTMIGALFQDSISNALAVSLAGRDAISGREEVISIEYSMAAGVTSAITFRLRLGIANAGTTTFNGTSGARLFGGVANSYIKVTEILQ